MNKTPNSVLDLKIAPKLDHKNKYAFTGNGNDWRIRDYPTHGPNGENWTEEDWQRAIIIFEDRIRGRYFNYIKLLIDHEFQVKDYHAGFAIIALDCLIVETLQQFYDGRDASQGSEKAFETFLTSSSFFNGKDSFGTDKSAGSLADLFYDQIRCGILHQAEVKTVSRIVSKGANLITREGMGIVVNRRKFHQRLVEEFECYIERLKKPKSCADDELRMNFRQKMDYICKVKDPPNPKIETVLYYAYGSNMKSSRIKSRKRAPSAKPIGRAKIRGKRLTFNKASKDGSGKANLVDDPDVDTWGVLYEIEKKDLSTLDKCEAGYQRVQVDVITDDGKKHTAETYIAFALNDLLKPYESYKTMILEGASEFDLPREYIESIRNVSGIPDPQGGSI